MKNTVSKIKVLYFAKIKEEVFDKTWIFMYYKQHLKKILNSNLLFQRTAERSEFMSFFYRHNMHVLTAPVLAVTATDELIGKGIIVTSTRRIF